MSKLALDVQDLKVETFEVAGPAERGGTVHANVETRFDPTCRTQCATGPCDCIFTDPGSCSPCEFTFPC